MLGGVLAIVALAGASAAHAGGDIRVEEFQRSAANPNVADAATRRLVLKIAHPNYENHYGGQLQFGPDGMLYAGTGDGGGGGDPDDNAQDTAELLGKLLRVDPRGADPYAIPAGTPFAGQPPCGPSGGTASCPEVYAYGLRNPFRFSFDRSTGDVWIGDVGQQDVEEIDRATAAQLQGADFGWDCFEGTTVESGCDPGPDYLAPVFQYPNPNPGPAAVTGGFVARDPDLTPLAGRYVYADFYSGAIRSFDPANPAGTDASTGLTAPNLASFGEDAAGRLHVVSLNGTVHRIACTPGCAALQLVPVFSGLSAPSARAGSVLRSTARSRPRRSWISSRWSTRQARVACSRWRSRRTTRRRGTSTCTTWRLRE